jgi:hypothetical protein
MMAGRPIASAQTLAARAVVPADPEQFFEGLTNQAMGNALLQRDLRKPDFNDQPVVVRP